MNEKPSTSQQLSKISVPKIEDSTFHVLRQALETTLRTSLQRDTVDLEPKYGFYEKILEIFTKIVIFSDFFIF
jgi:hypothetical protein